MENSQKNSNFLPVIAGSPGKGKPSLMSKMAANLKYVSLVLLVIQNAALILTMRHVRTIPGDHFFSTTAVVVGEVFKLTACLVIILFEHKGNVFAFAQFLYANIVQQPLDTAKLAVPAFIYMIQNNLLYVAVSNLPAATFQVSYQLKILTTAMFSVTMLGKSLSKLQWFSMVLLFSGVAIVQVEVQTSHPKEKSNSSVAQNTLLGLGAVILSCVSSGFAGVYFEKILKGSKGSIWLRNVQLSVFGALFGMVAVYENDGSNVAEKGFFFGYYSLAWLTILIQAFGGLLVAVVIKYADNILKGFATSIAIVVSTVAAIFLFHYVITLMFLVGAAMVIAAVSVYSIPKPEANIISIPKTTNA